MKVAVLISGGVDSSVALAKLAEDPSLELTAFYLKIWLEDELSFLGECPWEEDLAYAQAVCEKYGVPLKVVPLQRAYHERVVAYALQELERGHTPSPDLYCNAHIKFGAFLDAVDEKFDRVATGHYAKVTQDENGVAHLYLAQDAKKDQTYFLSRMSQAQMQRAMFPLADLPKGQVRELARGWGLPTAERPDSQGICFLGKISFPDFVRFHLGDQPGPIVDVDTQAVLGEHRGVWFYTVGQRRGLGLGGGPWFVTGRDLAKKTVYVSHESRLSPHYKDVVEVMEPRWLVSAPAFGEALSVKLRHGPARTACVLEAHPEDENRFFVRLESADKGIASGQFTVFYRGEECLGSAVMV